MAVSSEQSAMPQDERAALDSEIDEAIALCGGDQRATIGALLVAMRQFEEMVRRLHANVSRGFSRGAYEELHHPLLRAPWPSSTPATGEPPTKT